MISSYEFPHHIFRAYDIRGKVELLTPELIYAVAQALVNQYQKHQQNQIVIGYDARLTSPIFAKIIENVFLEHQFKVVSIGCCSSPQMYFAARKAQGNGIIVTASHNPKADNGIKWIINAEPPCPEMIQSVGLDAEQLLTQEKLVIALPQVKHEIKTVFCSAYQVAILRDIYLKRPLKVVIDGLNGSAGFCSQIILEKLGCEVIELRCNADGNFPDHAPDPSQATHLELLRQNILNHQADLGIALDGDGDRVVILDENAHIISADRLMALFAQICLRANPHREIVFDVKCSSMVRKTIEKMGGKATMIRTGSSFLRKYLIHSKGQAVFGGEYAGHYVFNDGRGLGYDDGLYAALRVMEYLCELPKTMTLSQVLAAYPERCYTEDTYISTHSTNPKKVLSEIESLSSGYGAELIKIDGIRLDFDHGFGIIRASNTGEFFTVRFDADNPSRLDEIRQTFASMLYDHYPMIAQDILKAH